MTGFVYVVQNDSGLYKIGFTNDPRRRLGMLKTGTHESLRLLGVVPATMEQEKQLHQLLASWRVAREWFRPSIAVLPLINGLRPWPPAVPARFEDPNEIPPAAKARKSADGRQHPLAQFRRASRLTQRALASRLNLNRWTINAIETGRRPPSAALAAVIEAETGVSRIQLRPDLFRGLVAEDSVSREAAE